MALSNTNKASPDFRRVCPPPAEPTSTRESSRPSQPTRAATFRSLETSSDDDVASVSSCQGRCGQTPLADDGFECHCDAACALSGDCCEDKEELCSKG